jgi:hypothetical protein
MILIHWGRDEPPLDPGWLLASPGLRADRSIHVAAIADTTALRDRERLPVGTVTFFGTAGI